MSVHCSLNCAVTGFGRYVFTNILIHYFKYSIIKSLLDAVLHISVVLFGTHGYFTGHSACHCFVL